MFISQKETATKNDTGYGEYIYELAGPNAGNIHQHSVAYVEIDPGKSNRAHYHPQVEETYYILSGEAEITINNNTQRLHPGQLLVIPPMTTHKIKNISAERMLTLLATCAQAWHKDCSVFVE